MFNSSVSSDSDSDSSSNADSDADSDLDSDSDTNTDSDANSDADSDSVSDSPAPPEIDFALYEGRDSASSFAKGSQPRHAFLKSNTRHTKSTVRFLLR